MPRFWESQKGVFSLDRPKWLRFPFGFPKPPTIGYPKKQDRLPFKKEGTIPLKSNHKTDLPLIKEGTVPFQPPKQGTRKKKKELTHRPLLRKRACPPAAFADRNWPLSSAPLNALAAPRAKPQKSTLDAPPEPSSTAAREAAHDPVYLGFSRGVAERKKIKKKKGHQPAGRKGYQKRG